LTYVIRHHHVWCNSFFARASPFACLQRGDTVGGEPADGSKSPEARVGGQPAGTNLVDGSKIEIGMFMLAFPSKINFSLLCNAAFCREFRQDLMY
jgi:hypothetical protein